MTSSSPTTQPASHPPIPLAVESAVIALGGAVGATLRFSVEVLTTRLDLAPFVAGSSVLVLVNLMGCFVLGVLVGALERNPGSPLLRPFLGVGVCGAFTTFSGFAIHLRLLHADASETAAAIFFALSLLGGALVYLGGRGLGRRGPAEK